MIRSTEPALPQVLGVPPALAKRRLERATRRKRYQAKEQTPEYERQMFQGMLLRAMQQKRESKYDPAECRRQGKR